MRVLIALLPVLALVACATPREACLDAATRDARVISALIAQTEGNIARGYGLSQRQVLRNTLRACHDDDRAGEGLNSFCRGVRASTVTVPRAVDLAEEERKLAQLRARLAAITDRTEAQVAACRMRYPAG